MADYTKMSRTALYAKYAERFTKHGITPGKLTKGTTKKALIGRLVGQNRERAAGFSKRKIIAKLTGSKGADRYYKVRKGSKAARRSSAKATSARSSGKGSSTSNS